MSGAIIRALGLQINDIKKLIQLGPIFFLTGMAYAAGILSSQSLFVSRFGVEYLPVMYLLEACILPLQLWLISYLSQKMPQGIFIKRIYLVILFGMLLCTAFACSMNLLDYEWRGFYPVIFLACSVLLRIMVPLIWMLGDGICMLQQAKRLFPVIGALFIVGGGLSGILAKIFAAFFAGFGTELTFLLMMSIIILSYFLWARIIANNFLAKDLEVESKHGAPMKTVIRAVWDTPLLRVTLISFIILMSLYYLIDYQFFTFASQKYSGSDAFTQFYGIYVAALHLVSLIIGLFINRIFNKLGISNTVFSMGLVVIFILLVSGRSAHTEWALQAFIGADIMIDVLSFTFLPMINQVFYKLLPAEQRAGVSLLFAGTINAGGKIISSGVTGLHSSGTVSLMALSILGFTMAVLYFSLTWKQRKLYFSTLLDSLQKYAVSLPELESFSLEKILRREDTEFLKRTLQGHDSNQELIALELSVRLKTQALYPAIKPYLTHPDSRKRLLALQAVTDDNEDLEKSCFQALEDQYAEIRSEAARRLKYILSKPAQNQNLQRIQEVLGRYLADDHPQVVKEIIITLYDTAGQDLRGKIHTRIAVMLEGDDEYRFRMCEVIGILNLSSYASAIKSLLEDEESPRVRVAAVKALGKLGYSEAIPTLLNLYPKADQELRQSIENSLTGMGEDAVDQILKGLESSNLNSWYLSVITLAALDQKRGLEKVLIQTCNMKLKSLQILREVPFYLESEGFCDLAILYRQRFKENFDLIMEACWKTLEVYVDNLLVERLKDALGNAHSVEKQEQALEILTEMSRKNILTDQIVLAFSDNLLQARPQQLELSEVLNKSKVQFTDLWLNRFVDHALSQYRKVGT